jgi:hypothetical protein
MSLTDKNMRGISPNRAWLYTLAITLHAPPLEAIEFALGLSNRQSMNYGIDWISASLRSQSLVRNGEIDVKRSSVIVEEAIDETYRTRSTDRMRIILAIIQMHAFI